ncbi:hypothetical protein E4U21_004651 [Claviceps maximensis]|nr:hypothetical protein E4U21_004651 [Claviceps maximensis]
MPAWYLEFSVPCAEAGHDEGADAYMWIPLTSSFVPMNNSKLPCWVATWLQRWIADVAYRILQISDVPYPGINASRVGMEDGGWKFLAHDSGSRPRTLALVVPVPPVAVIVVVAILVLLVCAGVYV